MFHARLEDIVVVIRPINSYQLYSSLSCCSFAILLCHIYGVNIQPPIGIWPHAKNIQWLVARFGCVDLSLVYAFEFVFETVYDGI
jgi:hypothetical protein